MNPISKIPRVRITSPLLSGTLWALVWLCVGAVLTSLIVAMTNTREDTVATAAFFIHGLAAAFGGVSSGKRAESKGWYHGFLLGVVYTTLVVLIGFLGFDAGLGKDTAMLFGIAAAAGAIGGMVGVNMRK